MSAGIAVTVLAAIGGAKALEHLSATDHQRLQKKTVHTAAKSCSSGGDVFAAHVSESNISTRKVDGNTNGVIDGVDGEPDLIVQDFPTHIVAEVEDADGLKDVSHVLDQLQDYSTAGYTTLLVVPDKEETLTVGREITERVERTVHVTTPKGVANYL